MSAHLLWTEVKDVVDVKSVHKAYSFFGHPSISSSLFVPEMDKAYIINPKQETIPLKLTIGDWLPGYGNAEHLFTDVAFDLPGDYVFAVSRFSGVYDLGWHGAKSDPFLSYNFAKAVVHAGDGPVADDWNAGIPIELKPKAAPYTVKEGDKLCLDVEYLGKPVEANYTASYWTWDEHGDMRVQRGQTDENGRFYVDLSLGGLWFIDASYSMPVSGEWKATYSLMDFFKKGDVLKYNTTRYKTTLSVWVR